MSQPIWLRTDEQKEGVRALEICNFHLTWAGQDPLSWKWALVALHVAIQNFVVASMTGPALLGTLKPHIAERWGQANLPSTEPRAEPVLDYFPELYARMKAETGYRPSAEVDRSISRLNEQRNAFIHFTPVGWLIHVNELPALALDGLEVIEALGWNPGSILWQSPDLKGDAIRELEAARVIVKQLDSRYRQE